MHNINIPLLGISTFFATGIIVQFHFQIPDVHLIVGVLVSLLGISLYFLFRQNRLALNTFFPIQSGLALFCLGALCFSMHQERRQPAHFLNHNYQQPAVYQLAIEQVLSSTTYRDRYLARLIPTTLNKRSGQVLLSIKKDSLCQLLIPGQAYVVMGQLLPIEPPANPHQFNYQAYMAHKQVHASMQISANSIKASWQLGHTLPTLAERLRLYLGSSLEDSRLEPQSLALTKALILGDRRQMDRQLYRSFADAGVVHLLAVSGLHVGILYWILLGILKPLNSLRIPKRFTGILAIGLLWGYALLTGLSPSVVRAVFMFSLIGLSSLLGRQGNSMNALFTAFLFLLLANPNWLFQIGFQLSFAAVCSILWLHPLLLNLCDPKNPLLQKLRDLLGVSIIAQLGVLPLCLYYFHQFPGLFWVSNLLLLPIMSLLLTFGLTVLFFSLLHISPSWLLKVYDGMLSYMAKIVSWVASQKEFVISDIPFNKMEALASYILLICVVSWWTRPTKFRTAMLVGGGVALFCVQLHLELKVTSPRLTVFQLHGQTAIAVEDHKNMWAYTSDNIKYPKELLRNYAIGARKEWKYDLALRNVIPFGDKLLLCVNNRGLIPDQEADIVLLRKDSQVALDRLLLHTKPDLVVADGSNYGQLFDQWEASCRKAGIPFHYTKDRGAFVMDQSSNSP